MLPAFQMPEHLEIYDIRRASYDGKLSITTMVGLINRPQPRIYLISDDDDAFWLKEVFASVSQHTSPVVNEDVLEVLLRTYRGSIQGLIIYDPDFMDSVNIATTLAGQRDGIVLSPAQVGTLQGPFDLPILADLRTYKWRTRLQAYRWAQQHLLRGASSRLVAGMHPTIAGGLRSFLVATRTFVYWLDGRDFLPDPRMGFLTERCLMRQILRAFPPGTVHLGWFIDEGSGVALASKAAIPVLASDYYSNLEVWTSIQPAVPYAPQETGPGVHKSSPEAAESAVRDVVVPLVGAVATPAPNSRKVYVSFTMSEGDNLQYNQHRLAHLWRDPARGSIPIGWTTSPVLMQAAPSLAAYYVRTATPNDELIAGPSGAGYIFPSRWPDAQLSAYLQRTGQLMQSMNLKVLQVLDTNCLHSIGIPIPSWLGGSGMALTNHQLQQRFAQALAPFGLHGLLSGTERSKPGWAVKGGVPVYQNMGLADSVNKAVKLIRKAASTNRQRPLFLNVYVLAWTMTPSDLKKVMQELGSEYEVVTPGTLLTMLAQTR